MNISKINCTPISPKSVSFGNSDEYENYSTSEIPEDGFSKSSMTEEQKLDALNGAYKEVVSKAPQSKVGKVLGNVTAIGLTAASFALVGTRFIKKFLSEAKVTKLVRDMQEAVISDKGFKAAENLTKKATGLVSSIKSPKLQGMLKGLPEMPNRVMEAVFNFDLGKVPKIFTRATQVATGAIGAAVATKDRDGDGQSDIKEKAVGAFKAADAVGSVVLGLS